MVALVVLGVFYWIGWLGGGEKGDGVETGRREWNIIPGALTGKKGKVDWEKRRESVRDAFLLSWKGYEEHGWGMLDTSSGVPLFSLRKCECGHC